MLSSCFFFFNHTATPEIYTLSLHDALPISFNITLQQPDIAQIVVRFGMVGIELNGAAIGLGDRKSTRLNSSHLGISYAVFCLKKKKNTDYRRQTFEPRLCV